MVLALLSLSSNVWGTTVTYSASSMSNKVWDISTSGTAPTGSSVSCTQTYSSTFGQATAGNSFTMTLSNFSANVTKLTFSLRSNAKKGQGNVSYSVDGGTEVFLVGTDATSSVGFNTWGDNTSFGATDRNVNFDVSVSPASSLVINVRCAGDNSIYFNGLTVTYTAAAPADLVTSLYLSEAGTLSDNLNGTYKVGDSYTLPSTTDAECGDKVLVGWSTVEIPTPGAKPTSNYYDKGAEVTLAATNTFYAVFADVSESSTEFHKGTVDDLKDGRRTLLVEYTDKKAVNSSIVSTKYLGVTNVTISNDKITVANGANCVWNAYKSSDKYQFKQGNNYLNSTGNDLYCNSTSDTWAFASGGSGYTIKSTNGAKYLEYYSNFTEFTCYSPASSNPYYFHIYVSDMEVSNYTTSCVECERKVTITKGEESNGTFTLSRSGNNVCIDDDATIIVSNITPAEHYHIAEVTTTNGTVTGPVDGKYTVTVTDDATIGATFEQDDKVTVTWMADGTTVGTTDVWPGETASAPADPEDMPICADAFVGWSTSTMVGEGYGAPKDLFNTTSPAVSAAVTYHAVFATAGGGESTVLPSRAGTITSGDYYIVDRYTGKNYQGTSVDYYAGLQGGLINTDRGGIYVKELPAAGYEIEGNIFTLKLDQIADANKPSAYHVDVANDGITIGFGEQTFYSQFNNGSIYADMHVSSAYICKWTAITNEDGGKHMLKITKGDLNSCLLLMDHTQSGNDAHYCKNNDVTKCGSGGTISGVNAYGSGHMYFIPAVSVTYSNYVTSCAVYTVTFKSNGADVTTVSNVAPGQQVTAPTLAYIESKVVAKNVCTNYLIGWSTNSHYSNPSAAPDDILKPNAEGKITIPSNITSDVTYYAVYADVVQQ